MVGSAAEAMLVLVTAAVLFVIGWELAARLWRDSPPEGLERACAATTIAFTIWIGTDWIFALTHTLTREVLIARTVIFSIAAAFVVADKVRGTRHEVGGDGSSPSGTRSSSLVPRILLALVAIWTAFILWRGAILPPVSHDALSNHLPRAVLFARAAGFVDLSRVTPAFDDIPVNYELLLADAVAMTGGDEYTEWLSTILYLLFIVAAGALAKRWWDDDATARVVMVFVAGIPVLLLHSGAHKNDLLVSTFMLLALLWAGRYLRTGETAALLLLVASGAMAAGTKPHGGLLAPALLPVVIWRVVQDVRAGRDVRRAAALTTIAAVACAALLGGYTWFDNAFQSQAADVRRSATPFVPSYGDWANLWQAPWVLAAAPFSPEAHSLYVPWEERPWFWQRREIYFAHLGIAFALCLAAAPFAVAAWRGDGARRERLAVAAAALAVVIAMLPVMHRPHGMYLISLPRYLLFFAPVVIAWTVGALVRRFERLPRLLTVAAAALFVFYAVDTAFNDTFAPIESVLRARQTPGTRHIPFDPYRATSQLDKFAGPRDAVALDVAWGSWIHPAFGPELARPVYFIPPGDGPPRIPDRVRWVVVERAFNTVWGNPEMTTLASARKLFDTQKPSASERRVTEYLRRDPRFRLVGEDPKRNQAIFVRVR